MKRRPPESEYHSYFSKYVNLLPDSNIIELLEQQNKETYNLLNVLSDSQALFRYAPKKWSIKELVGHLSDVERILSYTVLRIARGEAVSLPVYDKDLYVQNGAFNKQKLEDLLTNLMAVRKSTLQLLKGFSSEDWKQRGFANGCGVTVHALAYILAGHELHHCNIIKEHYFGSAEFPGKEKDPAL